MLNTTIHRHEVAPAYPQTVHEHRAPTDESVRTLRELEREARLTVERTLIEFNNSLKAELFSYPDGTIRISLTINGKTDTIEIDKRALMLYAPNDRIDRGARFKEVLCGFIAGHLLDNLEIT